MNSFICFVIKLFADFIILIILIFLFSDDHGIIQILSLLFVFGIIGWRSFQFLFLLQLVFQLLSHYLVFFVREKTVLNLFFGFGTSGFRIRHFHVSLFLSFKFLAHFLLNTLKLLLILVIFEHCNQIVFFALISKVRENHLFGIQSLINFNMSLAVFGRFRLSYGDNSVTSEIMETSGMTGLSTGSSQSVDKIVQMLLYLNFSGVKLNHLPIVSG